MIHLGVDTLSFHLRLETGDITMEEVLSEAAELGCAFVQVTLHHVRHRDLAQLRVLRARAEERGLRLLASGDVLGRGRDGEDPRHAVDRVRAWAERADALGSPILRLVSGFYRADLAGRPDLIELERRFVIDALRGAVADMDNQEIRLLLENHSDFRASEYESILAEVADSRVGVFLDVINAISGFEDPLPMVTALSPHAWAGHVKDYRLTSLPTDDGYHRRGFLVSWCYPGEGVADLPSLMEAFRAGLAGRDCFVSIEGLDNYADRADQRERVRASLEFLGPLVR
jgi:sugar phosphate isomerase/epimerase